MPRIARKNLKTQYFHVMSQGINKEFILETEQLKEKYKNLLRKNIRESEAKILAYCLMGNHVHILFQAVNPYEVTNVMQKVNANFARYYNYINERVGIVFRNRYFTQPIMSRRQLYNCLVYIHNNPVKAGIVQSAKDYKYSSYGEWIGESDIIDSQSVKLIYGEKIDLKTFEMQHFNKDIIDIDDIGEEIDFEEIINHYTQRQMISMEEFKNNEKYLEEVVNELRRESNISARKLSEMLNINRPKITKILNKLEQKNK